MNKYRKQIYRITSLLCCIVLIVFLAALPAYAVDYDDSFINYFEYSNAGSYYTVYPNSNTVTFTLPQRQYVRYVDLVIATGQTLNGVSILRGTVTASLNLEPIKNGYYRVYGELGGGKAAWGETVSFIFDVTSSGADIQFLQFRYSNNPYEYWSDIAGIWVSNASVSGIQYMSSSTTPVLIDFDDQEYNTDFYGSVYLSNWRKYDYIDVILKVDCNGFTSLGVQLEDLSIPYSISLLDSSLGVVSYISYDTIIGSDNVYYESFWDVSYQWIQVHVDLTTVNRSITSNPEIFFTGKLRASTDQYIQLDSCAGYIIIENQNQLSYWFSNLMDHLSDLFGKDDPGAEQAAQSQEQLNVEINNQVSAAVSDWDVHIVEVQDGYDSGFEGAVPALSWLSSLAEGIFGNMGWFGSIYLLVGLISVYVLFLNKGGLIGRKLK